MGEPSKARIRAAAAPRAGIWLGAPPSRALDLRLTNAEVRSRVGRRLGCEICEEKPCPFCLGIMDKWGIHAESCTAGGDKTYGHHVVRNDIYGHAKRGGMGPVLEAQGVMSVLGVEYRRGSGQRGGGERPADVLLCRAQDLQTGVGRQGHGRVALDVGIICPQAASHLADAAGEELGAAESYVRTKCGRRDTEQRCRDAGVVFQPMIFESLGGVSVEADRVIKSLNKAVASNTDSPEGEVATLFWHRLGIDLQRVGHRAFARRAAGVTDLGDHSLGRAIGGMNLLEVAGGV